MGPGDWPKPEKPSLSSCCVASRFFPPLAQHLAGFIMTVLALGTSPCAAGRCAGPAAAPRWPQVWGAARPLCAAPGTALGRTSQASPCSEGARLPSPSSWLWKVQQPREICCNHLIQTICTSERVFFFFNCRVLRLCQKALLRQNEMFREEKKKNNPNLLLFDLWQTYFK